MPKKVQTGDVARYTQKEEEGEQDPPIHHFP